MKKNQKGFTLVELLVAMAILGLLIALLIPGIGIVRRSARDTARKTSLQGISQRLEEYFGSVGNGKYPPTMDDGSSSDTKDVMYINMSEVIDEAFYQNTSFNIVATTTDMSTNTPCGDSGTFVTPNEKSLDVMYRLNSSSRTDYELGACLENGTFYLVKDM